MTDQTIAYSVPAAAEAVNVSARTISRAIADGDLIAHNVRGTLPRILRADLIAWIEAAPTERASA